MAYHCPTGRMSASIDKRVNSDTIAMLEAMTAMIPADEEFIITCPTCGTMYDENLSPTACPAIGEVMLGEAGPKTDTLMAKLIADAAEAGEDAPEFSMRDMTHTPFNEKTGVAGNPITTTVVFKIVHESIYDKADAANELDMDDEAVFEAFLATQA